VAIGLNLALFVAMLVLKLVDIPQILMVHRVLQTIGVHGAIIVCYVLIYKRLTDLKEHSGYIKDLQRSTLLFFGFVVQYLVA